MNLDTTYTGLEIAVIGMAGTFPGADNLEEFWANLLQGEESISILSPEELRAAGVHPALLRQKNYVRAKGVFPGLEHFDAPFFEYAPRDAAMMDPQVRVLHQGVYRALEDAGYASEQYKGSIGLFAGASGNFVWELSTLLEANSGTASQFAAIQLNDKDYTATRIAYKLNLRGPCVTMHCACSTSLFAIDLACRHLLTGSCNVAVAAGVGLTLPHKSGYVYEEAMIKSAVGSCRPFSADADGTVEGNGMGVVVLKPLEDALRDRDRIYAVIRSSASNNDGSRKVGYSAPSVEGQAEVIRRALHLAEVQPRSISYVETHGTGTALGDPVEIEGLKKAFRSQEKGFCHIGSLKSNIGHLDTAAGVSSFIKTVMALDRGVIPASLNFREANPQIDFENSPFRVITEPTKWTNEPSPAHPGRLMPRRAGVSACGIGGTNIHIIMEEAPPQAPSTPGRTWNVLCLSAYDAKALQRAERLLIEHLETHPEASPTDVAYTLQVGRCNLPARTAVAYRTIDELLGILRQEGESSENPPRRFEKAPHQASVAFMFSGQGTQYPGIALGLYRSEPAFREAVDVCLATCDRAGLTDVRSLLLNPEQVAANAIYQTHLAQPCLFTVEYAMAKLLMDWGITPKAMLGHSLGEYVAACVSGALTPEAALHLVITRGRLLWDLPEGAMLAVAATEQRLQDLLIEGVGIAAVNGPSQCTVSGARDRIDAFEKILVDANVYCKRLHAPVAAHSPMLDPILETFRAATTSVTYGVPQIPYMSNVTGTWITPQQAMEPDYYVRHMRETVRFADAAQQLLVDENMVFLELGPGTVLSSFVKQCSAKAVTVSMLRHAMVPVDDEQHLARGLGELWGRGVIPDWKRYHRHHLRSKLSLPTYSFEPISFPIGRGDIFTLLEGMSASNSVRPLEISSAQALGWQQTVLPVVEERHSVLPCLVLSSTRRLAIPMASIGGLRPLLALPGRTFHRPRRNEYRLNLDRGSDFRRLIQAIKTHETMPRLFTWLVEGGPEVPTAILRDQLLKSILALRDECPGQAFRGIVFMFCSHRPIRSMQSDEDAQVDAMIRSMRASYPELDLRLVYAERGLGIRARSELIERELGDEDPACCLVAYEGSRRWVYRHFAMPSKGSTSQGAFRGKTLGLIAPDGFPTQGLAQRIHDLSGATILPLRCQRVERRQTSCLASMKTGRVADLLQATQQRSLPLLPQETCNLLLDELSASLVARYIDGSLPLKPGTRMDRARLKEALGVIDPLDKYLDLFLHILEEDGVIQRTDQGYIIQRGTDTLRSPSVIRAELSAADSRFSGLAQLLEHCVASFPKTLSGEISAIEALYPGGQNDLLRITYEGSIQESEDEYLCALTEKLIQHIARIGRGKRLRILEVGGGYGVMMRRLVPHLKAMDVEYCFTDIGNTFLENAKAFALEEGHDFVSFGRFDITQEPSAQGLQPGSYDVVLAFNVVHATRTLAVSLSNLQNLLKNGGILCLLERTRSRRHVDLVWGLADGWWHFDETERQISPLMSLERWENLARGIGFEQVIAFPKNLALCERLDVGLLIAQTGIPAPSVSWAQPAWRIPKASAPLDGLVVIDGPLSVRSTTFQALGGQALEPHADYAGYTHALESWVAKHTPGFVSVWSLGIPAPSPQDEMSRLCSFLYLDQQIQRMSHSVSRVHIPLESDPEKDDGNIPSSSVIREALRAIHGGLRVSVVRADAQPLFTFAPSKATTEALRNVSAEPKIQPGDAMPGSSSLIKGIWSDLLGIENISPDDDFFALGGDSLKVAQMTTELEKHGLHLLTNEVFNHPTLRALGAYLDAQQPDAKSRVQTQEELVLHFKNQLGIESAFGELTIGDSLQQILFIQDSCLNSVPEIEGELASLRLPQHLEPHRLLPLSWNLAQPSENDGGNAFKLKEHIDTAPLAKTIQMGMHRHNHTVCRGAVEATYPLSPFQKMYLKGAARFSFYLIDFDEPLDLEILDRAFTDIVAQQGLLRSSLMRKYGGRLIWMEHAASGRLLIPMVDLSDGTPEAQQAAFEQLMAMEYEADFDQPQSLMYRVMLVRFNRRKYTLLFNLDHSIFDNMSGQVLRRQLLNRYRALKSGSMAPLEPIMSFRDYLEQLSQGPMGITQSRLVDLFELKAYEKAKLAVEARIVADRQPRIAKLRYEIDLDRFQLADDDEATWELSVVLLCCTLGRFLDQEAIPLKLVFQGRKYQDQSYFDTLGLFADVVPLLVRIDRNDPSAMIDGIKTKIRHINRFNISFMNMMLNIKMWIKWWKVLGYVSPKKLPQRDPMILLNYAGKTEKEYQKIIEFAHKRLESGSQKLDYASFYTIATVVDGRLVFDIFCTFAKDMDMLKRLFDAEVEILSRQDGESQISVAN